MRILAATDDSGSFKEIICAKGTDTSIPAAKQPKEIKQFHSQGLKNRIQKLIVHDSILITARANGQINFHETDDEYSLFNTITLTLKSGDKFINLFVIYSLFFSVTEAGCISIIDLSTIRDAIPKQISTEVKGPISTFIPHPTQFGIFAYGGKENDVKIIRLLQDEQKTTLFSTMAKKKQSKKKKQQKQEEEEEQQESNKLVPEYLYQAKNVKNDKLDLRVPIHPSKLQFINIESHTATSWELLCATRYGHVRTYNTTHGRKPKTSNTLTQRPILNVAMTSTDSEIICSDDHTTTATYDIFSGKLLGKFKGAVGAIQGVHSIEGLIVTGGLDRYVRVFDIDSRDTVAKVFVGSKISEVWLLDTEDLEEEDEVQDEDDKKKKGKKNKRVLEEEEEDEDEVWNQLEALEKKNKKTSKKPKKE